MGTHRMSRLACLFAAGALVVGFSLVVGDRPAGAATIEVTTTADGVPGSLREALATANATPGADTIVLGAGAVYELTDCASGQLMSTGGALTIEGRGATIRQTCPARIVQNSSDALLTLSDVTLTGGDAPTHGGAVLSTAGPVILTGVHATGNRAAGYGGAIYHDSDSTLSVLDSTIADNTAFDYGGAMAVYGGLAIESSTIADNSVTADDAYGGGIYVHPSAPGAAWIVSSTVQRNHADGPAALGGGVYVDANALEITDSTIADNTAGADGGGVYAYYDTRIVRSTVSGNQAGGRGGGVLSFADVEIESSTIASNIAGVAGGGVAGEGFTVSTTYVTLDRNEAPAGANVDLAGGVLSAFATVVADAIGAESCAGVVGGSLGHNYEAGSGVCGFEAATDVRSGESPGLGELGANGGPTLTEAPSPDSPLVNAIGATDPGCSGVDQRGVPRPQDGACDIGAVELDPGGSDRPLTVPRFTG